MRVSAFRARCTRCTDVPVIAAIARRGIPASAASRIAASRSASAAKNRMAARFRRVSDSIPTLLVTRDPRPYADRRHPLRGGRVGSRRRARAGRPTSPRTASVLMARSLDACGHATSDNSCVRLACTRRCCFELRVVCRCRCRRWQHLEPHRSTAPVSSSSRPAGHRRCCRSGGPARSGSTGASPSTITGRYTLTSFAVSAAVRRRRTRCSRSRSASRGAVGSQPLCSGPRLSAGARPPLRCQTRSARGPTR